MPTNERPRDLNELAKAIVDQVADEAPAEKSIVNEKDPAAVSLGRRGGLRADPQGLPNCLRRSEEKLQ
jgi:hypothetical protein